MNRVLYETAASEKGGYTAIHDYGEWRIAMTNDAPSVHLDHLRNFSRHLETDEAFVLLEGSAYLLLGDGDEEIGNITKHLLEKDQVFIVKKKTWHANITEEGAKILIIENRNTDSLNTEKKPVDRTQLPTG